jgi:hypothetical protein
VGVRHVAHDREAQPRARGARGEEGRKQLRPRGLRHPRPVVAHRHLQRALRDAGAEGHARTPRRREGIGKQVDHRPTQHLRVHLGAQGVGRRGHLDTARPALCRGGESRLRRGVQQRREGRGRAAQLARPRKLQQRRHEAVEPSGLLVDDAHQRGLLGVERVAAQRRHDVEDDREGVAHLVGHHRRHLPEGGEALAAHEGLAGVAQGVEAQLQRAGALNEVAREAAANGDDHREKADAQEVRDGRREGKHHGVVQRRRGEGEQGEALGAGACSGLAQEAHPEGPEGEGVVRAGDGARRRRQHVAVHEAHPRHHAHGDAVAHEYTGHEAQQPQERPRRPTSARSARVSPRP